MESTFQAELDKRHGIQSGVVDEVYREMSRQDVKWGPQTHPDGTHPDIMVIAAAQQKMANDDLARTDPKSLTWSDILIEEMFEVGAEDDPRAIRAELVQVAAVACNWIVDIDTRD